MRRSNVVAGAVLAFVVTGGAFAVNGGAQALPTPTLTFVDRSCTAKFVDTPPRQRSAPGPGDAFAASCKVFNTAGVRVGSLDVRCTVTKSGSRTRAVCDGVYDLATGHLYLATSSSLEVTTTGAITGGDGAYAGARGTFRSVDRPGEAGGDPVDTTITLLP